MPSRPRKLCAYPRCSEMTESTYCDKHSRERQILKAEHNKKYDKNIRDKKATEFYHSKEWDVVRKQALIRDHNLCQHCLRNNTITFADMVHHIVEIKEDWGKRLQLDNLISLCNACHNKITPRGY